MDHGYVKFDVLTFNHLQGLGFITYLGSFTVEFARIKNINFEIEERAELEEQFSTIEQPSWSALHKQKELPNPKP